MHPHLRSKLTLAALFVGGLALWDAAPASAGEVCNPPFAGKTITLRDRLANRALSVDVADTRYASARALSDAAWQKWQVQSAGGCAYYLVDKQHQQALVAADANRREPVFHEAHNSRTNARWKFLDLGGGSWGLVEQKYGRRLLAADATGESRIFTYAAGDVGTRTNAKWAIDISPEPTCNPSFINTQVTVKDNKYNRYLSADFDDPERPAARAYTGNTWQTWRFVPTGANDCAFYLRDERHHQSVLAGDVQSNNTSFHEPDRGRDNARWQFFDAGGGTWYLIEKKYARALVAGDLESNDHVFAEAHQNRTNARWTIAAPTEPLCSSSILRGFDDASRRRLLRMEYSNPKKDDGFDPQWSTQIDQSGHYEPVEMAEAAMRLPDRNGNAYFMFTASRHRGGYLWVVRVNGTSWTSNQSSGQVVWFTRFKNKCDSFETCQRTDNEGNFNYPGGIALIEGANIVAVTLQNAGRFVAGANVLEEAEPSGSDSLAFYDVTNPAAPVFMFKMPRQGSNLWAGGNLPDDGMSKVSIGKLGTDYYMMVGGGSRYYYKFPASSLTTSTRRPPTLTRLNGSGARWFYTVEDNRLIDVGIGGGAALWLSRSVISSANARGSECLYGRHELPEDWQREGCDTANGFARHGTNGFSVVCHWKKPFEKFMVLDVP